MVTAEREGRLDLEMEMPITVVLYKLTDCLCKRQVKCSAVSHVQTFHALKEDEESCKPCKWDPRLITFITDGAFPTGRWAWFTEIKPLTTLPPAGGKYSASITP